MSKTDFAELLRRYWQLPVDDESRRDRQKAAKELFAALDVLRGYRAIPRVREDVWEDAKQEVMLRLLKVRVISRHNSYLASMFTSIIIDRFRTDKHYVESEAGPEHVSSAPSPHEIVDRSEFLSKIREVAPTLPSDTPFELSGAGDVVEIVSAWKRLFEVVVPLVTGNIRVEADRQLFRDSVEQMRDVVLGVLTFKELIERTRIESETYKTVSDRVSQQHCRGRNRLQEYLLELRESRATSSPELEEVQLMIAIVEGMASGGKKKKKR